MNLCLHLLLLCFALLRIILRKHSTWESLSLSIYPCVIHIVGRLSFRCEKKNAMLNMRQPNHPNHPKRTDILSFTCRVNVFFLNYKKKEGNVFSSPFFSKFNKWCHFWSPLLWFKHLWDGSLGAMYLLTQGAQNIDISKYLQRKTHL